MNRRSHIDARESARQAAAAAVADLPRYTGCIVDFNPNGGYGFINTQEIPIAEFRGRRREERLFFHVSDCIKGVDLLQTGERVELCVVPNEKKGGVRAAGVEVKQQAVVRGGGGGGGAAAASIPPTQVMNDLRRLISEFSFDMDHQIVEKMRNPKANFAQKVFDAIRFCKHDSSSSLFNHLVELFDRDDIFRTHKIIDDDETEVKVKKLLRSFIENPGAISPDRIKTLMNARVSDQLGPAVAGGGAAGARALQQATKQPLDLQDHPFQEEDDTVLVFRNEDELDRYNGKKQRCGDLFKKKEVKKIIDGLDVNCFAPDFRFAVADRDRFIGELGDQAVAEFEEWKKLRNDLYVMKMNAEDRYVQLADEHDAANQPPQPKTVTFNIAGKRLINVLLSATLQQGPLWMFQTLHKDVVQHLVDTLVIDVRSRQLNPSAAQQLSHLPEDRRRQLENFLKDATDFVVQRPRTTVAAREEKEKEQEAVVVVEDRPNFDTTFRMSRVEVINDDFDVAAANARLAIEIRPILLRPMSLEHHIDTLFHLTREDSIKQLRNTVSLLRSVARASEKDRRQQLRQERVHYYNNVRFTGLETHGHQGICYIVNFEPLPHIRWNQSRRLMPGALVVLSSDDFATCLVAVVAARDPKELRDGRVRLKLQDESNLLYEDVFTKNKSYVAVESPVYWEATVHILKALQSLGQRHEALPLAIRAAVESAPGAMQEIGNAPRDTVAWDDIPQETILNLTLDRTQENGIKQMLRQSITVCQGSPGSGKSYIGAAVAKLLIEGWARQQQDMEERVNNKILVFALTNHALDTFLTEILERCPQLRHDAPGGNGKLIRLGGQSKLGVMNEKYIISAVMKRKANLRDGDRRRCWGILRRSEGEFQETLADFFDANFEVQSHFCSDDIAKQFIELKLRAQRALAAAHRKVESIMNEFHDAYVVELEEVQYAQDALQQHQQQLQVLPVHAAPVARVFFPCPHLQNIQNNDQDHYMKKYVSAVQTKPSNINITAALISYLDKEDPLWKHLPRDHREALHNHVSLLARASEDFLKSQDEEEQYLKVWLDAAPRSTKKSTTTASAATSKSKSSSSTTTTSSSLSTAGGVAGGGARAATKSNEKIVVDDDELDIGEEETDKWADQSAFKNSKENVKTFVVDHLEEEEENHDEGGGDDDLASIGIPSDADISKLSPEKRWALYQYLRKQHINTCSPRLRACREQYNQSVRACEAAQRDVERACLEDAVIIGATTTGMSKYMSMINRVTQIRTVLVEEAAEISEAQMLAALPESCAQVILIGDHMQLRPKINEYDFKQYRLDVSLMERLIQSQTITDYVTLDVQRRMRPEICEYIRPFYAFRFAEGAAAIIDHDRVLGRPLETAGTTRHVAFIEHRQEEAGDGDTHSTKNPYEAQFCVFLAAHARNQYLYKGTRDGIVIIAAYVAQVLEIRRMLRAWFGASVPENIRVVSLDDFQGEEADIIILSLVRSEKLGFLDKQNRIIVALSRARHGMFVVGNFEVFRRAAHSDWPRVLAQAEGSKHLMQSIELKCTTHGTIFHEVSVRHAQDARFLQSLSPLGGCQQKCNVRRKCGHACGSTCHGCSCEAFDCPEPCTRPRAQCRQPDDGAKHICSRLCFQQCELCTTPVEKIFECDSKHVVSHVACYINETDAFQCPFLVTAQHPRCSRHELEARCGDWKRWRENPDSAPLCQVECGAKIAGCQHTCVAQCFNCKTLGTTHVAAPTPPVQAQIRRDDDLSAPPARESKSSLSPSTVGRVAVGGGVAGGGAAAAAVAPVIEETTSSESWKIIHVPCTQPCGRNLPFCEHVCTESCSSICPPCQSKTCSRHCRHSKCKKACSEPCFECKHKCDNSCEHRTCEKLCHEICDVTRCMERCAKKLPCEHQCSFVCHGRTACPDVCLECLSIGEQQQYFIDEDPDKEDFDKLLLLLPKCKHVVDAASMDHWIDSQMNSIAESGRIDQPRCPVLVANGARPCSQTLDGCVRYKPEINKMQQQIDECKLVAIEKERQLVAQMHETVRRLERIQKAKQDHQYRDQFRNFFAYVTTRLVDLKQSRDQTKNLRSQSYACSIASLLNIVFECLVTPCHLQPAVIPADRIHIWREWNTHFEDFANATTLVTAKQSIVQLLYVMLHHYLTDARRLGTMSRHRLDFLIENFPSPSDPAAHMSKFTQQQDDKSLAFSTAEDQQRYNNKKERREQLFVTVKEIKDELRSERSNHDLPHDDIAKLSDGEAKLTIYVEWKQLRNDTSQMRRDAESLAALPVSQFTQAPHLRKPKVSDQENDLDADIQFYSESWIKLFSFESKVSPDELRSIHKALVAAGSMRSAGAWFRCKNGHLYVIGDCGGAQQASRCPVCGEGIGGTNYHIDKSNTHDTTIDGSAGPAWPTSFQ